MGRNSRTANSTIELSLEAVRALVVCNASDNRLVDIMNAEGDNGAASRQLQRWMAAQILGNLGYNLKEKIPKLKNEKRNDFLYGKINR